MNYLKIDKFDVANGTGVGVVLWVSGCDVRCKGCHNPETWDCNSGSKWTVEAFNELMEALSQPGISRLTLTGGHPLMAENRDEVYRIVTAVKHYLPHISIWLYTGYVYEDCMREPTLSRIIENCNVVVDGPFVEELYDRHLPFRGSSNQRILYVDKTEETKYA